MKFGKKLAGVIFICTLMLALVSGCGTTPKDTSGTNDAGAKDAGTKEVGNIIFATMPVGGTINTVGNALASTITKHSGLQASVSPFAGLAAWGPLMNTGEIGLGIASEPEVAWAYKGEMGFEKMDNIRMLIKGNSLAGPGIAVRKDSKINSAADVKGKRVASDYPGSASVKATLDAFLDLNGLSWNDVVKVPTPTTTDGMNGLRDNILDVAYGLTPNTPISEEINNAVGLKSFNFLKDYGPDQFDQIPQSVKDKFASYLPGGEFTIVNPQGYVAEKQIGINYFLMIAVSSHLSDDAVYKILDTLWNNYEEMFPVHPWLKQYTPENMFDPTPTVPYHPGAVKFFKDKGLWTDQTEQIQQSLLK